MFQGRLGKRAPGAMPGAMGWPRRVSPAPLTPPGGQAYIGAMNTIDHSADADQTLVDLESRIETLARACDRLRDENRMLRHQNEQLLTERSILTERGEQARIKVESMINRLKSMEQAV